MIAAAQYLVVMPSAQIHVAVYIFLAIVLFTLESSVFIDTEVAFSRDTKYLGCYKANI